MRITADQKIAGHPAVQIRQLMRETVGRSITLQSVRVFGTHEEWTGFVYKT